MHQVSHVKENNYFNNKDSTISITIKPTQEKHKQATCN